MTSKNNRPKNTMGINGLLNVIRAHAKTSIVELHSMTALKAVVTGRMCLIDTAIYMHKFIAVTKSVEKGKPSHFFVYFYILYIHMSLPFRYRCADPNERCYQGYGRQPCLRL